MIRATSFTMAVHLAAAVLVLVSLARILPGAGGTADGEAGGGCGLPRQGTGNTWNPESTPGWVPSIPVLDIQTPEVVRTATFALG